MKPLSEATAKIASRSYSRKYIAIGRIVNSWIEIVGESFADKAQPVKILYRKQKGKEKPNAILEIATSSAFATRMQYQKTLILERMNQIFGEEWITDIKFVPVVSNAPIKTLPKAKPLNEIQKKALSDLVFTVEDEDIKNRLLSLGTGIFQKD